MKFPILIRAAFSALLVHACLTMDVQSAPTVDGLFATFQISRAGSSVGEFSAKLEFGKAPMTVANFVGLAEGTFPFIDFQNGHIVQRKFYDGLTFHRVDKDPDPFVIQGGSPKGDGSDGPGYTFRDEFEGPESEEPLRHDKPGILSMANSGLNSNGSQFFVTLAATPWLDDVHSVFGEIVEGMDVVNNVQAGDVIQSVVITRNGTLAEAFDPASHGLPAIVDAEPTLLKSGATTELVYSRTPNSEIFVFHGEDLGLWSLLAGKEMFGDNPGASPRDVSDTAIGESRHFYTVAQVNYPDPILTPPDIIGKKITLTSGAVTVVFLIDTASGGSFAYSISSQNFGPYSINSYAWTQEAYRGHFVGGGLIAGANISFEFTSPTSGWHKGILVNTEGPQGSLSGTFIVEDIE